MLTIDVWKLAKGMTLLCFMFFEKDTYGVKQTMSPNEIYSEMFQPTLEAWGDKREQKRRKLKEEFI